MRFYSNAGNPLGPLKIDRCEVVMNIGEAAKASGVTTKMIRHYESIKLIGRSLRTEAGYRTYNEQDVSILRFIKSARSLGFSLEQIKLLLSLWQDHARASADVKALATEHIQALDAKIDELTAMRNLLHTLAASCQGDKRADCPILTGLSKQ